MKKHTTLQGMAMRLYPSRSIAPLCAALVVAVIAHLTTASAATYYVSPSGNDTNSGTSTSAPWKTIAKVNGATFNGGDTLLLQGGQTFTGTLNFARARVKSTPSSKFTVGAYGTGKPTIISVQTGETSAAVMVQGVSGIVVQDLIVRSGPTSPRAGIYVRNDTSSSGGTAVEDITIQRCDVGGFKHTPGSAGAAIYSSGYWGKINNFKVLNNVLHGLNGPSSQDDAGFYCLGYSKNITNLTVQGNIVYDIGGIPNYPGGVIGCGIVANGVNGGVLQYNIVHDIGANMNSCGGPGGIWTYNANNVTIQFNEVYKIRPITYTGGCDWVAYDIDGGCTNCTVQYNYSHDNFGPALLAFVDGTWGGNVFRYNVSENDAYGLSNSGVIMIAGPQVGGKIQIYNNTIYDASPQTTVNSPTGHTFVYGPIKSGTWAAGSMIKNNIFYGTQRYNNGTMQAIYFTALPQTNLTLDNNVYYLTQNTPTWRWGGSVYTSFASYQAGTGLDQHSLLSDPKLVAPATGGTLSWNPTLANGPQPQPSGYQLQSTSPLFGAGANLGSITPAPGTRDYYGNTTPNGVGSGYNIGAYGKGSAAGGGTTIYEAETATSAQSDSVTVSAHVDASGGQYEKLNANAVNDYITYTIPVAAAGTYEILMRYPAFTARGKFQLSIGGVNQGPVVDQYAAATTWLEVSLGTKTFSAGNRALKFTVTGKNAASPNYYLAFDYIKLVKQ